MRRPRFFARKDRAGSWSVVDGSDGQTARMRGVLLVGLGQELAIDMVRLLVLEDRKDRPYELS
jgi:hypothetical protein